MTTLINGVPATPEQEKEMEREAYFRQQNIKSLYAVLYSLGLDGKTEKVRNKLDLLSQFFGHIGAVSNMSDEELCVVGRMLDELKIRNYKFTR